MTANTFSAANVSELEAVLGQCKARASVHPDEIYIETREGNPATLRLIEEALTDSSKVYKIEIQ